MQMVKVFRFHTEIRMKFCLRGCFPNHVNPASFLEGGVQADVYISRGTVTGFQFHSKIAWPLLIYGKLTIPIPEIADLLR